MRVARLSGLTLVVFGGLGFVLALSGVNMGPGSAIFPVSVVVGIVTLYAFRPTRYRRH